VYIGSAPGIHLPLLYDMYPTVDWLLYDPRPFDRAVAKHPAGRRVTINTGEARGMFDDTKIPEVRAAAAASKGLLFISDIRDEPTDEQVVQDMIIQARWLVRASAQYGLLKIRFPYEHRGRTWNPAPETLGLPTLPEGGPPPAVGHFTYLDGELRIQVNAPVSSTEMRLIVQRQPEPPHYTLRAYDIEHLEQVMHTYNDGVRTQRFLPSATDHLSRALIATTPGYDASYESCCEIGLLRRQPLGAPQS
jgi:hypothetical protein